MTVKRLSRAGGLVAGKEESSIKLSRAESFYDCSVMCACWAGGGGTSLLTRPCGQNQERNVSTGEESWEKVKPQDLFSKGKPHKLL